MSELRLTSLATPIKIQSGDDLVTILIDALKDAGETLARHDLVVVTSKVVSKSEGQVVPYDGTDEHKVAIVEGESVRVLRRRGTLRITETRHGFINANAGVDLSNTEDGTAVLLPKDPDRSARRLRAELSRRLNVDVAVLDYRHFRSSVASRSDRRGTRVRRSHTPARLARHTGCEWTTP